MKRILSMLLIVIMLFSMIALAACGDGSDGGNDTQGNDSQAGTDPNDSDSDSEDADTKKPDDTTAPADNVERDETGYELVPDAMYHGKVGVGTWATSVIYDDLKVTNNKGNAVLYENDFSDAATLSAFSYFTTQGGNWDSKSGNWKITTVDDNGVLSMPEASPTGTTAVVGNANWANYTVSVKGKITGGAEGLVLYFNVVDENNYTFLSVGGWNNSNFCVQQVVDGKKSVVTDQIPIKLKADQWYTLKVRVNTNGIIYGYLDDEQIMTMGYEYDPEDTFKGSVGLATWNTSALYKNVKVTELSGGKVLLDQPFTSTEPSTKDGWSPVNLGGWSTPNMDEWVLRGEDGIEGTNTTQGGVSIIYDGGTEWTNYKLSLDACKTGGGEAFIICFAYADSKNLSFWNIGGWGNTKTCYQFTTNGTKTTEPQIDHKLETGVWYHIECVVTEYAVFSYIDGELLQVAWK